MATVRRRGFTLLELLMAVSILALLAGLLLTSIAWLRGAQRKASTMKLLQNLSAGIAFYLDKSPLLPSDFDVRYMVYLGGGTAMDGVTDTTTRGGMRQTTPGTWVQAYGSDMEAVCDAWGWSSDRLLTVQVDNVAVTGRQGYTRTVILRSKGSSLDDPDDDMVMLFSIDADYVRANPATYNLAGWNLTTLQSRVFDFVKR